MKFNIIVVNNPFLIAMSLACNLILIVKFIQQHLVTIISLFKLPSLENQCNVCIFTRMTRGDAIYCYRVHLNLVLSMQSSNYVQICTKNAKHIADMNP